MSEFQGPRIAIIGVGKVGAAAAYSIIYRQLASEVLIMDAKEDFQDAQIQDLRDSTSFGISPRIRPGSWKECGQCDIVVFTAGTNQKAGESRLALVGRNLAVIRAGFEKMMPFASNTILLMVTNPVDIMTFFALRGTILDITRLKDAIAQRAGVAPRSVQAYVVGEHGDTQTIAWSNMAIGGIPADSILGLSETERTDLAEWIKYKADRLNKVKGETSFGIGAVIANICTTILLDERHVLPLSHYHEAQDLCFSTPVVLGRQGLLKSIDIALNASEQASLDRYVAKLRSIVHAPLESDASISVSSRL